MTATPTRLYRALSLTTIPVVAVAFALMVDLALHPLEPNFASNAPFWNRWLYGFVFALVNIVIGALCMRRAPGNIIGPLLVIYGAGLTTNSLRASFDPLSAVMIGFVGGFFGWIGFFVLVLLFPNGSPHPRWMRWFLAVLFAAIGCYVVLYFLGSPYFTFGDDTAPSRLAENPFFIPALGGLYQAFKGIILGALTPIIIVMLPVSVYLRFRAGSLQEKAQIRWILWGVVVMLIAFVAQPIVEALGMPELGNAVGAVPTILVFILPAFAVSNAILRHKLYDIDIIIRRTLIYSILTAVLAAVYFGAIIIAQQVFRATTGEIPDIAIVISTLLIATLFTPLRRRIQNTIDRRLYRRKYDVERTLARFNQTLRDEVHLEALEGSLIGVVQDTMQPTKIALWVWDSGYTVDKREGHG
jgi:hypothetical protein